MGKREWEKITLSITPDQRTALEKRADEEACSISLLVRKAIDMFLAQPALFVVAEQPGTTPADD